jgi:hypothetical protein
MKDIILKTCLRIVGVAISCGFIYGAYWVAKTTSYTFFYESMVESTVMDMVKPEYLK